MRVEPSPALSGGAGPNGSRAALETRPRAVARRPMELRDSTVR
jgi:hypothetical protein